MVDFERELRLSAFGAVYSVNVRRPVRPIASFDLKGRSVPLTNSAVEEGLLDEECAEPRARLMHHPLYAEVCSIARIRVFMEHHVFAVWDFMTLLKRLQRLLTRIDLPWIPPRHPEMARLINEIVLAEESDEDGRGGYTSHFQLYREAMLECGADPTPIDALVEQVRSGADPLRVLRNLDLAPTTAAFVRGNLELAARGAPHEVAAAFCLGREDIIPEMFTRLENQLQSQGYKVDRLKYYLNRHIQIDGESHGPASQRLLSELIGSNPEKRDEAAAAARAALESRIQLWDGVLEQVRKLSR